MDTKLHKTTTQQSVAQAVEMPTGEQIVTGEAHGAEAKPEASAEYNPKITESIERESQKLEQNLEAFRALVAEMSPSEDAFVCERMQATPEGKNTLVRVQETMHKLIHSYEHSKEHLSNHYDPRLVKIVGGVGKAIGGLTGLVAGHGVLSAPGSVAGSKAGGYLTLKAFEELVHYLPTELHDKIRKPKSPETISVRMTENEQKIQQESQEKENLMNELGAVCDEFTALPEDQKKELSQIVENNETDLGAMATKVQNSYGKYLNAFKEFEKKHPIVATGVEIGIHAAISPILGSLELGEALAHAIEVVASTGGAEKFTTHMFSVAHHLKESIHTMVQKMSKFDPLTHSPQPETAA